MNRGNEDDLMFPLVLGGVLLVFFGFLTIVIFEASQVRARNRAGKVLVAPTYTVTDAKGDVFRGLRYHSGYKMGHTEYKNKDGKILMFSGNFTAVEEPR